MKTTKKQPSLHLRQICLAATGIINGYYCYCSLLCFMQACCLFDGEPMETALTAAAPACMRRTSSDQPAGQLENQLPNEIHSMAWVGRDLKDHEAPTPLLQSGLPTSMFITRPGCPGLHPTWPWTLPGMGHLQPIWAVCSSTSPLSQQRTSPWYPT